MIKKSWMVHGSIAPPWLQAIGGTSGSLSTPLGLTPMELNVFIADQQSAMQTLPEFTGPTFARETKNVEMYAEAFTSGARSREDRPRGFQGYRMNSQERLRRRQGQEIVLESSVYTVLSSLTV